MYHKAFFNSIEESSCLNVMSQTIQIITSQFNLVIVIYRKNDKSQQICDEMRHEKIYTSVRQNLKREHYTKTYVKLKHYTQNTISNLKLTSDQ